MSLDDYVRKTAVRGICLCEDCVESTLNPKKEENVRNRRGSHDVNLTFFSVSINDDAKETANAKDFKDLVIKEYPHWLDGKEHSYIEIGAEMGDQGIALLTIGLGHLLGVWQALSPDTLLPMLPNDLKNHMAGLGMVSLQVK